MMFILFILLQIFLGGAAIGIFLYSSTKTKKENLFLNWIVLILIFYIIIKLAGLFLNLSTESVSPVVSAVLDLGFTTAFTAFIFMRCKDLDLI